MSRRDLFDAVRLYAPGMKFTPNQVLMIDALADSFGYPRVATETQKTMTASQKAIDLMHEFESCVLTAYPDPGSRDGNPWTIGWGSTGPDVKKGLVWTKGQADARFSRDLAKFSAQVGKALEDVPTTQGQFDAMVSFAYNVGIDAFRGSTLLKLHKSGDYTGARAQFARWNKNDGKIMNGLTRRRASEAKLYGET